VLKQGGMKGGGAGGGEISIKLTPPPIIEGATRSVSASPDLEG